MVDRPTLSPKCQLYLDRFVEQANKRSKYSWQSWDVARYRQALGHPLAVKGFQYDFAALSASEVVVLLLPSGRSAHTEAAWHRGRGGVVVVHSPEPGEPELMYKVFNALTAEDAELLDLLDQNLERLQSLRLDVI